MAGDRTFEADDQDQAEIFDETNITRDGEDIAHPDMERDVYDVTSADDDDLEEDAGLEDADDFDPDQVDEAELEFMLESDDGVDEPRSFARDEADLVARGDDQPKDFESRAVSDEDLQELGYEAPPAPSQARRRRERLLDEGIEETFPASDPVSISPGSD